MRVDRLEINGKLDQTNVSSNKEGYDSRNALIQGFHATMAIYFFCSRPWPFMWLQLSLSSIPFIFIVLSLLSPKGRFYLPDYYFHNFQFYVSSIELNVIKKSTWKSQKPSSNCERLYKENTIYLNSIVGQTSIK